MPPRAKTGGTHGVPVGFERQPDGTIVVYLNDAFEPVPQAKAVLAKILKPDGSVIFATRKTP